MCIFTLFILIYCKFINRISDTNDYIDLSAMKKSSFIIGERWDILLIDANILSKKKLDIIPSV